MPERFQPPSPILRDTEPLRSGMDLLAGLSLFYPISWLSPRGDGSSVLTIPGFTTSDASTGPLRLFLRGIGYSPSGYHQGPNIPSRHTIRDSETRLIRSLERLYHLSGSPVHIVGQSLGGIQAHWLARSRPGMVASVTTLGSPYRDTLAEGTSIKPLVDLLIGDVSELGYNAPLGAVHTYVHSIYSTLDGIADWRACIGAEAIVARETHVPSSHCGMGVNPLVWRAIAQGLSESTGRRPSSE